MHARQSLIGPMRLLQLGDSLLGVITWRPGFHDNDFTGWLVTAGYVGTVVGCFHAAKRSSATIPPENPRVWGGLGIVLLLLGLNQQLDLQTLIIQAGREAAASGGWYEHRRFVQKVFFGGFAVGV